MGSLSRTFFQASLPRYINIFITAWEAICLLLSTHADIGPQSYLSLKSRSVSSFSSLFSFWQLCCVCGGLKTLGTCLSTCWTHKALMQDSPAHKEDCRSLVTWLGNCASYFAAYSTLELRAASPVLPDCIWITYPPSLEHRDQSTVKYDRLRYEGGKFSKYLY